MNKIYRTVYNESTQTWVAVSELDGGHVRSSAGNDTSMAAERRFTPRVLLLSLGLALGGMAVISPAQAASAVCVIPGTSTAVGTASGNDAIACGQGAVASANLAIAIGAGAEASGLRSTALGSNTKASASDSIGIGSNAVASSIEAVAIGRNAKAGATAGVANNNYSIAIGSNAVADAGSSIAVGLGAQAITGSGTVAIGQQATVTANRAIAIGSSLGANRTTASAADTVAFGTAANAGTVNAIAIGINSSVKGDLYSGNTTNRYGMSGLAVGMGASVNNRNNGIAIGSQSKSILYAGSSDYQSTRGDVSDGKEKASMAIGQRAEASGDESVSLGFNTLATGRSSVSVGESAAALDTDAIAIGNDALAGGDKGGTRTGHNSTAIGSYTKAVNGYSTAIGTRSQALNSGASALGSQALAREQRSTALGNLSYAGSSVSTAVGYETIVADTAYSSSALGSGSVASGQYSGVWSSSRNLNPTALVADERSFVGGNNSYAIGNKNVIGSSSSDTFILGNNVKLGATAAMLTSTNSQGTNNDISTRTETVGYTGLTNITGMVALGSNTGVAVSDGVALGQGSQATVAKGVAGYDPLNAAVAPTGGAWTSTLGSVSVGTSDGTVTRQITGVAAGSNDADAVNVAQLKAVANVADSGIKVSASAPVAAGGANPVTHKLGNELAIVAGNTTDATSSDNLLTRVEQDAAGKTTVTVSMKENPTFTSVVTTDAAGNTTTINGAGVTVQAATPVGGTAPDPVSITTAGINAGDKVISNVASGGTTATNAANIGDVQKAAAGAKTEVTQGDNIVVTKTTDPTTGADSYEVATAKDVTFDTVNVGGVKIDGASNKISGLAAGSIASGSTEAVNGGQIKAIADANQAILGGNSAVNADGTTTMSNIGGTGKNNINDAIAAANTAATQAKSTVSAGDNINVIATKNADGSTNYQVATAKDLKADSLTTGNTVVNSDGITIGNGAAGQNVSLTKDGLNNGGNTITNVAAGVNATDAVNKGQLDGAIKAINTDVTNVTNNVSNINKVIGGDTYVNKDGSLTDAGKTALTTYNVQGQTEYVNNSVISAIKNMNEQGIKYFHTNDGQAYVVEGTNSVDSSAGGAYSTAIGYQATATSTATNGVVIGKGSTVSGENGIALGYGSTAAGKNSIAIGTGNTVTGEGSGAIGDPNTVSGKGSYAIGNNNTVSTDDSFVLGNDVTTTAANSVNLGSGSAAVTAATAQTAGTTTYASTTINGTTYQFAGATPAGVVSVGDVGKERRVQNVAAGLISETSTDAINGSQLHATNKAVESLQTGTSGIVQYSDAAGNPSSTNKNDAVIGDVNNGPVVIHNVGAGSAPTDAANVGQLQSMGNQLNTRIDKVERNANAGVAQAIATAGLPQAYLPGKSMMAIGGGYYQGETGYAVGFSTISDSGNWVIKATGSGNSRGNFGASVGAGYQW